MNKEKERERLIVRPRPLKGIQLGKAVFVPMDSPGGFIRNHLSGLGFSPRKTPQGRLFHKDGLAVHVGCIGAPASALALEPIFLSGAAEVLILGFCGSLVDRLRIGDAVVVTRARSDEGTSRHYLPGRRIFEADGKLTSLLEERLEAAGLAFSRGSLVSTDAPYRETTEWLEKFRLLGAEGVDMEASAVFALAEYYGIASAALMIVSDELDKGRWKSGFGRLKIVRSARRYFLPLLQ
jgi:uridine phosphorylase